MSVSHSTRARRIQLAACMCLFGLYSIRVQHVCPDSTDPTHKIGLMPSHPHSRFVRILALLGLSWGILASTQVEATSSRVGEHLQDGISDFVLERPLKTSVRLLSSDEVFTVSIDHWNAQGLHGSRGTIAWEQIQYESLKRVFHKLMDRNDPEQWILLGTLQLSHPQGPFETEAERSFQEAMKRSPSSASRIRSARLRAADVVEQRRIAAERAVRAVNQATRPPGGPGWLPIPWESLSFSESRERFRTHEATVRDCLRRAGLDAFHDHDAGWLMVFTDLPPLALAEVLEDLELVRDRALSPFRFEPEEAPFQEKLILVICDRRADFERIEERCFAAPVGPEVEAICHASGASILINVHHGGAHPTVLTRLLSQLFIAAQHHHVSPAPLPRWAFEGLRDQVTAGLGDPSPLDRRLRPLGHRYIRDGGDLSVLLNRTGSDEPDPLVDPTFRAVAYLTCSLMMRENPEGFANWIRAVKSGESWRDALSSHYGVDFDQILHVTREWYLLND